MHPVAFESEACLEQAFGAQGTAGVERLYARRRRDAARSREERVALLVEDRAIAAALLVRSGSGASPAVRHRTG